MTTANRTLYSHLGRSKSNGVLHAVRDETMGRWDAPEAFCGAVIGATKQRSGKSDETRCAGCVIALREQAGGR